jgi:hypothetical protein
VLHVHEQLSAASTCFTPLTSQEAVIHGVRLVVWDESPVAHRHVFEPVNRTFRHMLARDTLMAGSFAFGRKDASLKSVRYSWSYLASRIGHLVLFSS